MSSQNIATLVDKIESEAKGEFLGVLRQTIQNDIASRPATECLTVIAISPGGFSRRWSIAHGAPYFPRLWAFMRNKPYEEDGTTYELDSALTAPILEIVTIAMTELITAYEDEIADVVVAEALINASVRDTLIDTILQTGVGRVASSKVKSALTAHLLACVQDRLHALGVHALAGAGAAVAKIASMSAGPIILQKMATVIVAKLGPIAAEMLAKPAVIAMLKKFASAAILASVMKTVAAKLSGAPLASTVLPVIAGWLVVDYSAFPRKLAGGIGEALCGNLKGSFGNTLNEIISKIVQEFSEGTHLKDLALKLANDPEIAKSLDEAMKQFR